MEIVFEHKFPSRPKATIVLLDWSCRESFHTLYYLSSQTVRRPDYEIIWIEYYSRRSEAIDNGIKESLKRGNAPIVDKWIVLDMPRDIYYHKHLLYNVGIIAGSGKVVTFCDSDAIMGKTFVESIIKSFEDNPNIALHMDEVRNTDRRFYPFNYPPIAEVLAGGCINWKDGATTGILDEVDPLHTRNYGACFSARREDLIKIGGADEHMDYLGHICGPYDMTFRLKNAGLKEVWHRTEFLYHLWHPGTDGEGNYLGPHDGKNMSTTALDTAVTGRILPLVENPAIKELRLGEGMMPGKGEKIIYEPLIFRSIPEEDVPGWTFDALDRPDFALGLKGMIKHPLISLWLARTFLKMLSKQLYIKLTKFSRGPKSVMEVLSKLRRTYDFIGNMSRYYVFIMHRGRRCITELAGENVKEFALYGANDAAEILYLLSLGARMKIGAVFDKLDGRSFLGLTVLPAHQLRGYGGKVVVTSLVDMENNKKILEGLGIEDEKIMFL